MRQSLSQEVHRRIRADVTAPWIGSIGLALAVSISYFLAAQLGLELLTKPDRLHILDDAGHGGGNEFMPFVVGALKEFAAL